MIYPDYDRSSLSITASVSEFFGGVSAYPTLPELDIHLCEEGIEKVILVLSDGLGERLIRRHLPADSFLLRHDRAAISAVFPSTTTAATTSIWTGVSPLEHGWLGWSLYFKECAAQIDAFTGNEGHRGERFPSGSPARTLMPLPPAMCGQTLADAHMIGPYDNFAGEGFAQHAVKNYRDMLTVAGQIVKQPGRKLVCIYNPQPDHCMHQKGVNAPETVEEFKKVDRETEAFHETLSRDTLLIVTADHGLVDGKEPLLLNKYPSVTECLWMPPSIEGRAAAFFVKPFRRGQFEREFNAIGGEDFVLISREDALSTDLFGRGIIHPKAEDFMGDYIACATGSRFIRYDTISCRVPDMIGMHAGLTDEEMTVPVIIARGERN